MHLPRSATTPRIARIARLVSTLFVVASCAEHEDAVTGLRARALDQAQVPLPTLVEEPIQLTVPTYERSGEVVHPDVVEFPNAWNGRKYWFTVTPYPKNDALLENPSILMSHDGQELETPAGLSNPIVPHSGGVKDYNSDPELVYDPASQQMLLFYRFVDKKTNTIYVTSSKDGVHWQAEPKVFWVRAHAAVSPTVTPQIGPTRPTMWYIDTGKPGCHAKSSRVMVRYSANGRLTGGDWTKPVATDLKQPGYVVWHMKVRYIESKGEYWALYAAFPEGPVGCDIDDLFFARSTDGVHWQTFPQPLIRHEDRAWTGAAVYRSTFLYDTDSDQLRVWFSARGTDAKWRLGLARYRYSSLLGTLSDSTATQRAPVNTLPMGMGRSEIEP